MDGGRRDAGRPAPAAVTTDRGSAVVEFVLVVLPLLMLLLLVVQVAVYLYVRNVVAAAAAEGARYGANVDRGPDEGAGYAEQVLGAGLSARAARGVPCAASEQPGESGLVLVAVRCRGAVPTVFSPLGSLLPVDVTARALEEGT